MTDKKPITVQDLIKMLQEYPPDAEVYVATDCHSFFDEATGVYRNQRGMVVILGGE